MPELTPSLAPALVYQARRADELIAGLSTPFCRTYHANSMLVREGESTSPRRLASGWAGAARYLVDGRRQIIHVLLPKDLICIDPAGSDPARASILALTKASVTMAGAIGDQERQSHVNRTIWCMQNQICRIGRQSAYERIANLFAELRERLALIGQASADTFEMPLTQDVLGDTLGLTSVHVNRTLQQMRRDGLIRLSGRIVTLLDRPAVERIGEYRPLPRD